MEKSQQVDCKNYNETVPKLMSNVPWIEFVVQHAQGHLEYLEWAALRELHRHKRNAIATIPYGSNSIEYFERVAKVFTNYRRGVLDIEYFSDNKSGTFINRLKKSLQKAKKEMKGKNATEKKRIGELYANQFVREMDDFVQSFHDEYTRIMPIIFPGYNDNSYSHHL